jgi:hypothetical protein
MADIVPIQNIGEKDWIKKLTQFLEDYDVEVLPLTKIDLITETEQRLKWEMPNEMKEYFENFGGIDSSDFMYNLKHLDEFINLSESIFEFVNESFDENIVKDFIVFSESPGNDPLCINKKTGEIYLFSHDPIKYGKVYNNFNDFLLDEIISIKELMGDLEFENQDEKLKILKDLLCGENIDYEFRLIKLE